MEFSPLEQVVAIASHADRKVFTLLQLNTALRNAIHSATGDRSFWIKAEIVGLKAGGHAFLELAQHENGVKVAVMRGIIWRSALLRIEQALGAGRDGILKEGSEILFRAIVQYHEVHGLSLIIDEIDLSFSLGELERRKRETIEKLKAEGLFDLNRSLPEPLVIQRIALVSSSGTAAYSDFVEHLHGNEFGYRFHVVLFNSIVQGESAARELRSALGNIDTRRFDAVVLIRGGGSKLDLEAFNDLQLCRDVARMPIPVMTGIGHEIDVSVVDLVAHGHHRTPTAIADHIVDKCASFEGSLQTMLAGMQQVVTERMALENGTLGRWSGALTTIPQSSCRLRRGELHQFTAGLQQTVNAKLKAMAMELGSRSSALSSLPFHKLKNIEHSKIKALSTAIARSAQHGMQLLVQRLNNMQEAVALLEPQKVLQRGFSISRVDGKALTQADEVLEGKLMETTLAKGKLYSRIERTEQ
jgi:exodeoxyribonuclease VII large subunit